LDDFQAFVKALVKLPSLRSLIIHAN